MASAFVSAVRLRDKRTPNTCGFVGTCYFWGDDVPSAVEGHPQDVDVAVSTNYTLAELKTALIAGAQGLATTLGLTVASSDVDMLGFDNENAQ